MEPKSRLQWVPVLFAALALPAFVACGADKGTSRSAVVEVGLTSAVGSTSQALKGGTPAAPDAGTTPDAAAGPAANTPEAGAPADARAVRLHVKEIRIHIAGGPPAGDGQPAIDGAADDAPSGGQGRAEEGQAKKGNADHRDAGRADAAKPDKPDAAKGGQDDADSPVEGDGPGWVTVFSGDRVIDISAGSSLHEILGAVEVPAGRVTQIRLVLASTAQLIDGNEITDLACGSCEQSGLKIVPGGPITLEPGEREQLVLAFDVEQSVVQEGDAVRLKPVIRLQR